MADSGVTGSNGQASFTSNRVRNASSPCWTLTVANVTVANGSYNPGANAETSDNGGSGCSARVAMDNSTGLNNYPNPFNPTTVLSFNITSAAHVVLNVYDASGRLVTTLVDEQMGVGPQSAEWNGRNRAGVTVPSGIYFARLQVGNVAQTRRMVLLK